MAKTTKPAKRGRKKTILQDGITIYKNSKGFGARIAENGKVLADMGGYNTVQNLNKGLDALSARLKKSQNFEEGPRWIMHKHPNMLVAAKKALKLPATKK